MSYTIHYEMSVKKIEDIDIILGMAAEQATQFGWKYELVSENGLKGIVIDTRNDECETLSFDFEGFVCQGFVKYLGAEQDLVWRIFDILWYIKPKLNDLVVFDEMLLWDEYETEHLNL